MAKMVNQFTEGMNAFGNLWDLVRNNWIAFLPCFTNMRTLLTKSSFKAIFKYEYSPRGTNHREKEEYTIYSWELVLNIIEDKLTELTFEDLLIFITGADEVPMLGFPNKPSIDFYTQEVGVRRLPYASTCAMTLFLPRGITEEQELHNILNQRFIKRATRVFSPLWSDLTLDGNPYRQVRITNAGSQHFSMVCLRQCDVKVQKKRMAVLVSKHPFHQTLECQKLLSTAVNTTSNLNKHLQRTHAKVKLIAKDPRTQSEDVVSAPPPTPKQQKLEFGGPAFKVYEQQHPASDSDEGDEENQVVAFTDVAEVLSTNLEQGQFSLSPHLSRLGIKALTEREHQFLKEYCTILKPLTVALDILQGEDNCYYGSLLPTLEILMSRTLALQTGLSRMTAGHQETVCTVLDSRDALLAAVTLPKFKVRWLTEEERREAARALVTTKCRSAPGGVEPGASHQESAASYSTINYLRDSS
ncbi:hypothetical protein NQZ68_032257 [Dissostichus eleginoides]|nr:hypothetical protein NQZ68_032257 [Dissostichus eleginoides]